MKRLLFVVSALALLLPPAVVGGSERARRAPVTIPFELANRHIIVKGLVNGSEPVSFVLDTGANRAILMLDRAKQLKLSLYGSVKVGGAGSGLQDGEMISNATWALAGLESLSQPLTMALPLGLLSAGLGVDVDGIIGGEFIKQFVVEVNFQARTLTFHDPATFTYSGSGETLPLSFTPDLHPVLTATVTAPGGASVERPFVLDLGSGGALVLHSPFVKEQKLPAPSTPTIRAIGAAGAGGKTTGLVGRMADLQIGSAHLSNVITMFSEDEAGAFANASLAGNIGEQIACRFRMFLDYGRKRLILERSAVFADPFDRAFSGIAIRAEGSDHRSFRIQEVLDNSAATDAGLQVGDVITSVDGRPANALTLTAIIDMFEKPGTYDLTITRDSKAIAVKLSPRKMV